MKQLLCGLVVFVFLVVPLAPKAAILSGRANDHQNWDSMDQGLLPQDSGTDTGTRDIRSHSPKISFIVTAVLMEGIIFLLPGVALSCLLDSYHSLDRLTLFCACFVGSGAMGYLVFWVYLFSTRAGRTVSVAVLVTAIGFVGNAIWRGRWKRPWLQDIAAIGMLIALVSTFYLSLGFLYQRSNDPLQQAQLRFVHPLPSDNTLPYIFADKLYHSQPVRPFLLGDWKSSDRPPLQAGFALFQFTLWSAKNRELEYQILGTYVQCMWLAAIWTLLRSLAINGRTMVVVFTFCIFSGFFLVHSFYVWPKLLAASYFIFAVSILRFTQGNAHRCTPFDAAVAGLAVALALLSHAGVIFSVIALGIVLIVTRALPPARSVLVGFLTALLFLLPWMMYQKLYDPPGDRLLKWHLAGVTELDSRSFPELLNLAYTRPSASAIIRNKIQNIETLFGHLPPLILKSGSATDTPTFARIVAWYKEGTFFYLIQALGVLNFGFLVFLVPRVLTAKRESRTLLPMAQRLFLLTMVSIVVWCLVLYIPGSTLVHAGSLADVVILFVLLAVSLASTVPRLTYVLLGFQLFLLFPLFAMTDAFGDSVGNTAHNSADSSMLSLSLACLLALGILAWRTVSYTPSKPGRT